MTIKRAVTRRELMGTGLLAGAATSFVGVSEGMAGVQTDAQALADALEVEQVLVVAYRRVLAAPALTPAARPKVQLLLTQELEHVKALEQAMRRLGGSAPPGPPSLEAAQAALKRYHVPWSLSRLRSERACLKLLIDLESVAENAYFNVIGKLHDPSVLRTCAAIMGCEAQHWTVLSAVLNDGNATKAVPYPFVGGAG